MIIKPRNTRILMGAVLCIAIGLTGCDSRIAAQPSATTELGIAFPGTTRTHTPGAKDPAATITPLPTRPTEISYPLDSPLADWAVIDLPEFQLSLQYPPGMDVQTGADESIQINTLPNSSAGQEATCTLEANRQDLYGRYPMVSLWNSTHGFYGCAIQPSEDALTSQEGTLLAWYPFWVERDEILQIRAPLDIFRAIAQGLVPTQTYIPPSHQSDLVPSECYLNKQPPEQSLVNGLRITTYRLTSSVCHQKLNVESFATLLPKDAAQHRTRMLHPTDSNHDQLNLLLEPFGYQIEANVLYHQKVPQTGLLEWAGKPLINAAGTRFILPFITSGDYSVSHFSNQVLPPDGEAFFYSSLGYVPHYAFLGDDLLRVNFDSDHLTPVGAPSILEVYRENQQIFTMNVLPPNPASGPLRGLYSWNGHWFLEVSDVLIRDGIILNQELGYSEIFAMRWINNLPFYLYRQGEQIHLSYNGLPLPPSYQQVIHEPSCCSGALVNMTLAENGIGFFAEQDEFWYYVIIEGE